MYIRKDFSNPCPFFQINTDFEKLPEIPSIDNPFDTCKGVAVAIENNWVSDDSLTY
jgi:hypothetical protein